MFILGAVSLPPFQRRFARPKQYQVEDNYMRDIGEKRKTPQKNKVEQVLNQIKEGKILLLNELVDLPLGIMGGHGGGHV